MEEKGKLLRETEALKQYQAGWHGKHGEAADVARSRLEDALYELLGYYSEVEGFSDIEARDLVVDEVKNILGA